MNKFQRKLNKLKRDPKLFISDMVNKHTEQLKKHLPIKYNGHNQYTVVSAVYNVGRYLDDYFSSLTQQTLDFKKHIQLILVDDGSTDNSAEIIKKWQKKFPENIHYIYKENGGIASARNLGLSNVKTKWVTFIDSDDFVHPDYFKIIDDAIYADDSIKLAVGNLKFFFEETQSIQDTHPLRFRFEKEKNLVPIDNLDRNINLFVTVSFFQTDILHKNNIIFDDKIKPNFEDGKFLADYFLHTEYGNVAYLQKAVFFYRKRGDGSSTIDTSWQKKEKFSSLLRHGYIPMLISYKQKYGEIPKNIQWTVIYDIIWAVKTLLNADYKLEAILSNDEIKEYLNLLKETLNYIDDEQIIDFNLIGTWFFHKVGLLGLKDHKPSFDIMYIKNIDREKQQILISYFQKIKHNDIIFNFSKKEALPKYQKIAIHTFAKEIFLEEVLVWLPYQSENDELQINCDNNFAKISIKGKQKNTITIAEILKEFSIPKKYQSDNSWIIMDRDIQADDNGEHFYRYMMKNHPEQKCYFSLNKESQHWDRLQNEGFNLLDFGSQEYEKKLQKANKIISSFFEDYIVDYFNDKYEYSKKFIFLQHGVIKDDLSKYLNTKDTMFGFITSTIPEYNSIADNNTHYLVGKKETLLTGLARHDNLLIGNQTDSKSILIMPTWRNGIIGKQLGKGHQRSINEEFIHTKYAQCWKSLLISPKLKNLIEQYGYTINFALHANIEPYLEYFNVPKYINVWSSKQNISMQNLFQKSKILITDYSSVAFEMALLDKSIIYYQFDKDEIYSGLHTMTKGYFEYERDGFGPVVEEEGDLLKHLEEILQNNGNSLEPYSTRAKNTFPFRDGKNCERIYQAIMAMDKPENPVNLEIALPALQKAIDNEQTNLIVSRYELLLENGFEEEAKPYQETYLQAKNKDLRNQIEQAWENQQYASIVELTPQQFLSDEHYLSYFITALRETSQWQKLLEIQATISNQAKIDNIEAFILAHYRLGLIDEAYKLIVKPEIGCRYEYWALVAELAFVYGDNKLASYCYKYMIAMFPNHEKADNLIRFANCK